MWLRCVGSWMGVGGFGVCSFGMSMVLGGVWLEGG